MTEKLIRILVIGILLIVCDDGFVHDGTRRYERDK